MSQTVKILIITVMTLVILSVQGKNPPETYLPFMDYCKYFGYAVEQHQFSTDDGYILTYFRIQSSEIKQNLPVVQLQHGFLDSSDTFIVNYKDQAPAFVLADHGYDVWLGNNRGNKHSKAHLTLSLESKEFWDFSWPEMAKYDLPKGIEYIVKVTNQQTIDYIGHSQGTMIMFAALSQHDTVVKRYIRKFIALAPVVFLDQAEFSQILNTVRKLSPFTNQFYNLGIHSALDSTDATSHFCATACHWIPSLCGISLKQVSDLKPELDNLEHMPVVMGHYPAGASLFNLNHFNQMNDYKTSELKMYDYGKDGNIKKYGSDQPPTFPVEEITGDIYLFSGKYDLLADQKDVRALTDILKIKNPNMFAKEYEAGHATFIWGQNTEILQDILTILN